MNNETTPDGAKQTLARLLADAAAQVASRRFATAPAAELQALLEPVTKTHQTRGADLSHVRAAAAAVGLSATIDRRQSIVIFRALRDADDATDYVRISGLVECDDCGYVASDHPTSTAAPFLTVMCDGRLVKL